MRILCSIFLLSVAVISRAEMMSPTDMPTQRVLKNLKARLAKDPKSAESHYLLGRAYYTAFCARDPRVIGIYGRDTETQFLQFMGFTSPWDFKYAKVRTDRASVANIRSAISHLLVATKLGGGRPGLYQLTLACAYEASGGVCGNTPVGADKKTYLKSALNHYENSYLETKDVDWRDGTAKVHMYEKKWISVEAGESILRLSDHNRYEEGVERHLAAMKKLPRRGVTPLIFSLTRATGLTELLDSCHQVSFDLDGSGAPQRYTWVKPDTAFLVWQPDSRVRIHSGRQLF
ncbi:MAG: hypothetical protein K8R88_14370, partial [Armatimonadetes bacterium]|nr:hypothetical protein [Armatimonadota bacterium]